MHFWFWDSVPWDTDDALRTRGTAHFSVPLVLLKGFVGSCVLPSCQTNPVRSISGRSLAEDCSPSRAACLASILPGLHPPPHTGASTPASGPGAACRARHPGRRPVLALGLPAAVRLGKGLCRGHPHPLRVPVLYQLPPKCKSPLPRALLLSPGA